MDSKSVPALIEGPTLNNGVRMPWLGLGVYKVPADETVRVVKDAVATGYRRIDTASFYGNEEAVGRGIRECGVPREELFVATKLWNNEQGYEKALMAFDRSIKRLGFDYLDLYLVHWAVPDTYRDTWKALVHLLKEGYVRAVGVSNHKIHHLQTIMKTPASSRRSTRWNSTRSFPRRSSFPSRGATTSGWRPGGP